MSHREQTTENKEKTSRHNIWLLTTSPTTLTNRELIAAGVRKFACGISPAANAKTLRKQPDGKVLVTDGPYTETKEHIGGFWILECADLEEALAWARKGGNSCDAAGEVRELLFFPAPEQGSGGSK
jgi:hypothetical protein